jgi:hypothetical protein
LKEAFLAGQLLIWVLNRNRVTNRSNVATQLLTAMIAAALPNSITRKRPPQRGFVQVRIWEVTLALISSELAL